MAFPMPGKDSGAGTKPNPFVKKTSKKAPPQAKMPSPKMPGGKC